MQEIYSKYISKAGHVPVVRTEELNILSRYYSVNYLKYISNDKQTDILDVGCGGGAFLYFLQKKGYQNITGIDISKEQVEIANFLVNGKAKLVNDTEAFLKNNPQKYNFIVMNDVIEHIPKRRILPLLKLCFNCLKEGGLLMIKTPSITNPFTIRSRYRDFTHTTGFTEESIMSILSVAGYGEVIVRDEKIPLINLLVLFKLIIRKITGHLIKLICALYDSDVKIISKNLIAIAKKT